ncbi:MAG: hypothetical protein K5664_05005 [Firmicutes bacterium]|nr:hypothetical protein [Bacillota bacterium]
MSKSFKPMKEGSIVNLTVYDVFSGDVKIIKNRLFKWLVEIINVNMCYSCQKQLEPGERLWIYRRELYMETDSVCDFSEEDLPF